MAANGIRTHARTNQRRTLDQGCGNPQTQDGFNRPAIVAYCFILRSIKILWLNFGLVNKIELY